MGATKRARTSEEYSDTIDAFVESIQFPKFLQPKALHLKAQFRTILCNAVIEKEQTKSNEWYLIRDQLDIHLVTDIPNCVISETTVKIEYDEDQSQPATHPMEPQIGDRIRLN